MGYQSRNVLDIWVNTRCVYRNDINMSSDFTRVLNKQEQKQRLD